jgi:hypothetical protein
MTAQTLTPPATSLAVVVADTADWLADQLVRYEARGMSRPGSADRFRRRAQSYRRHPQLLERMVQTGPR